MTESVKEVSIQTAINQRNYRRARDRALTRLRQAHLEEYCGYLAEERERDEEMGRSWISDNSTARVRVGSYKDVRESELSADYDGEAQGNDGGEA